MSFKTFVYDEYIIADEFNDNFSWIGGGDWLPRGGSGLAPSDSVYDLGSQTYKWNNIYAHTLDIDGNANTGHWNKIAEVTLTATSQEIEFTGLNIDLCKIICNSSLFIANTLGPEQTATLNLYINNDSGTNYGQLYITGKENIATSITALQAQTSINLLKFHIVQFANDTTIFSEIDLCSKFNLNKNIIYKSFSCPEGLNYRIEYCFLGSAIYNSTATLTSIKFIISYTPGAAGSVSCAFGINTNIQIWSPIS